MFFLVWCRQLQLDSTGKTELIPVECPDARAVRNAFKKLARACVPASGGSAGAGDSSDQVPQQQKKI